MNFIEAASDHYNYWIAVIVMMIGLYGVIAKRNIVKQAISLGLFQTGIFLLYISMAVVFTPDGKMGEAPVKHSERLAADVLSVAGPVYDNPLPHVLMLTAIVVSVSILAVALAIIVNIKRCYGTVEEDEILDIEAQGLLDGPDTKSNREKAGALV